MHVVVSSKRFGAAHFTMFNFAGGSIREASKKSGLPISRLINVRDKWKNLCDRLESIRAEEDALTECYQTHMLDAKSSLEERRALNKDYVRVNNAALNLFFCMVQITLCGYFRNRVKWFCAIAKWKCF